MPGEMFRSRFRIKNGIVALDGDTTQIIAVTFVSIFNVYSVLVILVDVAMQDREEGGGVLKGGRGVIFFL